jgi:hypothetical protein
MIFLALDASGTVVWFSHESMPTVASTLDNTRMSLQGAVILSKRRFLLRAVVIVREIDIISRLVTVGITDVVSPSGLPRYHRYHRDTQVIPNFLDFKNWYHRWAGMSSYTVPLTRCRVLLYLMDSTSRATVSVSQLVVLLIMYCSMQMMLVGQQFQPSINILKEGSNK